MARFRFRSRLVMVLVVALAGFGLWSLPKQKVGGCSVGCQNQEMSPGSGGKHLQDESEEISK